MTDKDKIVLLFPDGVGIRNYLYSAVFRDCKSDLILFHNFDKNTITAIKDSIPLANSVVIPKYKETIGEKFLRELICLSRLYYNARLVHNPVLLTNWNWKQETFSKKIFYKIIQKAASLITNYPSILKLEARYQKAIRKNTFYKEIRLILKNVGPKTIFCSHQRGLKVAPIFLAAKELGIETTTVIYSWDNLPKARMAFRADNYLVWSNYMKNELELYYSEISTAQIHITGTPQFEFYDDPTNIIEKEFFYKKYNLDLNKKIICFSGDDIKTSPDDPSYLKDLAEEILKAGLENEYQILFRRCPVDLSNRFDLVLKKYNGLIKEVTPLWTSANSNDWTTLYPSKEDVKLLVSTAFYSDIVFNIGSTMAFDFALFNKPCVFINYDQEKKNNPSWSVETIYKFQHFRSMPNDKAVIWLNNKESIIACILHKEFDTSTMQEWKNIVIGDYKNASRLILEKIQLT